jgi:hypothetical protein
MRAVFGIDFSTVFRQANPSQNPRPKIQNLTHQRSLVRLRRGAFYQRAHNCAFVMLGTSQILRRAAFLRRCSANLF